MDYSQCPVGSGCRSKNMSYMCCRDDRGKMVRFSETV